MKKFKFNIDDFEPIEGQQFSPHDFEPTTTPNAAENIIKEAELNNPSEIKPYPTVNTIIGEVPKITDGREQILPQTTKEDIQKAASLLLPLAAPEIKSVPYISNLLSKIPGATSIGNMLGRIGYGTAVSTAPELLTEEGRNNLPENIKKNAVLNSLLEVPTMAYRAPRALGELFNPLEYGIKKSNQIKNEASAIQALTDAKYKPVTDAYNNAMLTITPKKYLEAAGIKKKSLYKNAQSIYDDFMKAPTFKNLHDLQSQIGNDWARISKSPANEKTAQQFNHMRNSIKDKIQGFLSTDPKALEQYKEASDFARDNLYPYYATPTLKSIAKGKLTHHPEALAKSISKGVEKTVGKEERPLIPATHPLRNHLSDLNQRINLGKASQYALPAVGGGLIGELLHPGLGGALSGIGASQIPNIAYKLGAPSMTGFIQNPAVKNIFNKTESPYYRTGRAIINAFNEQQ